MFSKARRLSLQCFGLVVAGMSLFPHGLYAGSLRQRKRSLVTEGIRRINRVLGTHARINKDDLVLVIDPGSVGGDLLQQLHLVSNGPPQSYLVSLARKGLGEVSGSYRTPRGVHLVQQYIGDGEPRGMRFIARKPVGVINISTDPDYNTTDDTITSRILWLGGLEARNSNSFNRYIYIHGTDEEGLLGSPASHGCVRMGNDAVMDLYNRALAARKANGRTLVYIADYS